MLCSAIEAQGNIQNTYLTSDILQSHRFTYFSLWKQERNVVYGVIELMVLQEAFKFDSIE